MQPRSEGSEPVAKQTGNKFALTYNSHKKAGYLALLLATLQEYISSQLAVERSEDVRA